MPLLFPSHPGLMAPLWRRWPDAFVPLAASLGAMAPDLVDGIGGLHRGHLGQAYGHSLFGLCVLALPLGLALNEAIKAVGANLARRHGLQRSRLSAAIRRWSTIDGVDGRAPFLIEAWSVWIGALSHLIFDFVSHGNFLWLYPWYENAQFFPDWWYARWFEIEVPFYASPYPFGPHFMVWIVLSILGAVLFFAPVGGRSVLREDPARRGV
jgi:hypothetical protein